MRPTSVGSYWPFFKNVAIPVDEVMDYTLFILFSHAFTYLPPDGAPGLLRWQKERVA